MSRERWPDPDKGEKLIKGRLLKKPPGTKPPSPPAPPPKKPIGPPCELVRSGGSRFLLMRAILDRLDEPPLRLRLRKLERRVEALERQLGAGGWDKR